MNRVDLSSFHLKNDIFKETLILALAIAKTKTYNWLLNTASEGKHLGHCGHGRHRGVSD